MISESVGNPIDYRPGNSIGKQFGKQNGIGCDERLRLRPTEITARQKSNQSHKKKRTGFTQSPFRSSKLKNQIYSTDLASALASKSGTPSAAIVEEKVIVASL